VERLKVVRGLLHFIRRRPSPPIFRFSFLSRLGVCICSFGVQAIVPVPLTHAEPRGSVPFLLATHLRLTNLFFEFSGFSQHFSEILMILSKAVMLHRNFNGILPEVRKILDISTRAGLAGKPPGNLTFL
jgi:hypothetical protein